MAVVVAAGVCVAWYDGHLYQVFDNRITFKRMIYFNKHLMSSGAAVSGFRTSDLKINVLEGLLVVLAHCSPRFDSDGLQM